MSSLYAEYLKILELPIRKPDYIYLTDLICSHLRHIPFENISKIYYKNKYGSNTIPDFDLFISGVKANHFGGTCYSTNYYFNQLLKFLGYNAIICGADMANPDVHLVNIVKLEGHEYIVDVGYAAPFLEPLPRDLETRYEINFGYDKYTLLPKAGNGYSKVEQYRNNKFRHSYTVKPYPRLISEFKDVIKDSFSPSATFMNSILLTKFGKDSSTVINDFSLIEFEGTIPGKRELVDKHELIFEIVNKFQMPRKIVMEVIDGMG